MEALVERAKQAFDQGCMEIWLTSEDLGKSFSTVFQQN
jgi:tRNA A37 methylthiotransferase MiaB